MPAWTARKARAGGPPRAAGLANAAVDQLETVALTSFALYLVAMILGLLVWAGVLTSITASIVFAVALVGMAVARTLARSNE